MIRVAVAGAGRMGQAIAAIIEQQRDLELAGLWDRGGDLDALVRDADVIIDFSLPAGTEQVLVAAVGHHKPLVCGVSGLSDAQYSKLQDAAAEIALLYDRNMSLGVAVLTRAVRDAAASLGRDFEVTISETHHVHKKDAPSGTALKLAEAVSTARGEQGTGSVVFHSERRGEVPGDHEVVMRTDSESLTFAHSVTTRKVFALGAVRAARWIVGQPAGQYLMSDVLFQGN